MVTSLELQRRGLRYGVIVDAAATTASLADLERAGLRYKVEVASGVTAADRATLDRRGLQYFVPVAAGVTAADKATLERQGLRYAVQVDADILPVDRAALEQQGLSYFVEVDSSGNSVAVGGGDVGGAALLTDETNGFATDFTYATDAQRVAVKTAGTVVSSGLDAFFSNAGTSPKQVFDVSGNLVWSPHNMLLRSEDFTNASWVKTGTPIVTAHTIQDDDAASQERADQSVTCVVGQNYTVSLWVLKDAVTTRFPAIQVTGTGGYTLSLNTSTGVTGVITSTFASVSSLVEDLTTHWKVKITFVAENATTSMRIYPAYGIALGGAANNTAVGTITIDKVQWNRGAVPTEYLTTTSAARMGLAVDYDPVTHAAKGLLCEPAATNLLLNSTTLSTQSVTVTAVAHTLSFLGTGTITLTGVSTAGPLVGTGVSNRVSLTFTPTAGSLTCTVSGTVSNAQLETGIVATSPILTFAASATRAVDNVSCPTSSFPFDNSFITLILDAAPRGGPPVSAGYAGLSDNTANERHNIDTQSGVRLARLFSQDGGVAQVDVGVIGTPVADQFYKIGVGIALNDFAVVVNGGTPATDVVGTLATVNKLYVGCGQTSPGNTYVRQITVLPRRMINAELQTATTP